jgi:hypothetical protein
VTDATRLLAMLEPMVRPAGMPGPAALRRSEQALPLEQRSFESLLQEAKSAGTLPVDETQAKASADPLAALKQLAAVENAGVWKIQLAPEAR